jgi:probable HAF family extracellular repeat protein
MATRVEAASYSLTDYGVVTAAQIANNSHDIILTSSGQVAFVNQATYGNVYNNGPDVFYTTVATGPDTEDFYNPLTGVRGAIYGNFYVNTPSGPFTGVIQGILSNSVGDIVALAQTGQQGGPYGYQAFIYNYSNQITGGLPSSEFLPLLPGSSSVGPGSINSSGLIVGAAYYPDGTQRAFLFNGQTTVDLNQLIPPGSGLTLTSAVQIDDMGQIVGYATDASGAVHEVLLTPTVAPEPSTLYGFVVLLSSLYGIKRFRKR